MTQHKLITEIFNDIYTKKFVVYRNYRLKTINLITIIDLFMSHYTTYKKDKLKISSKIFKTLYGAKYNYYLEFLVDNHFIYLYKNYSVGVHSKVYALTDYAKNSNKNIISININNKQFIKEKNIRLYNNIDVDVKKKLILDLYKVNIDYNSAKNWLNDNIETESQKISNLYSITKINNKNIDYSFDTFGRFHTSFTNLKKEIRHNFLTINGNKLKEIDIKNSQPFFLYILMKENGFKDFDGFDMDVLNGVIYEKFIEYSKENISRKKMKSNLYSVLFGRTMTTNKWNIIFKNKYPKVYDWIITYKKTNKNYKIIAQTLQVMESNFIFNKVINAIIYKYPKISLITVHDSIIFEEQYYDIIQKIFNEELSKLIEF